MSQFINQLESWIVNYSYALVGFFLIGTLILVVGSWTSWRRLSSAGRQLAKLSHAEADNGATEQTHRALLSLLGQLADRGGDWWAAVQPTVVKYGRDGPRGAQTGYFVTERIEDSVLGTSTGGSGWQALAHAVPGVLTSLGLLGTFVALLIGLSGLQPDDHGAYNLSKLISNLSGKFVTSIVALALSVLFVILEIVTRSTVTRARYRLAQSLSRVLPFLSPSRLLVDVQQESARQAISLNALQTAAKGQSSVLEALHKVSEEQSGTLKALSAFSERQLNQLEHFNTDLAISIGSETAARIVPVMEQLLHSTNELHRIQANLGEELLKEVSDKISGAVSGAAGEEMRSMSVAISESVRSLNEASQAMRDGQNKLVEVTSAIIGQMNQETKKAVVDLVSELSGAAEGFTAKLGGAGHDVAAALLTTSKKLQSVVEECQRLVTNTEATVVRFDGLVASVSGATRDIVSAHEALRMTAQPLQAVADRTATLIDNVGRQVKTIGQAAESLHATSNTMNDVQDALKSSWSEYERRFANVDEALGNSMDGIHRGFDLYADKIRELNFGVDTHFSKALSNLSSVVSELHDTVEELQDGKDGQAASRR